jgi:hypothetical protein
MKPNERVLFVFFLLFTSITQAQDYNTLSQKADSLFKLNDFKGAANTYTKAFQSMGWKGYAEDRYKAGISWALLKKPDSAFHHLFRIAQKANFKEYERLVSENRFKNIQKDKRWKELLALVKNNKEESEKYLIQPLAQQLE